jgi:hypothetical protein
MKRSEKYDKVISYKGYTIIFVGNNWRALAYANPQFDNSNLKELKKQINNYLKN